MKSSIQIDKVDVEDGSVSKYELTCVCIACRKCTETSIEVRKKVEGVFEQVDETDAGALTYPKFKELPIDFLNSLNRFFIKNKEVNFRFPKFIPAITILQILIHLYINVFSKEYSLYDVLKFDGKNEGNIWTYLTYMLVHKTIKDDPYHAHIISNLVVQLFYSVTLESFNPGWKVLLIYLGGGLCGVINHMICNSNDNKVLCGASAGVCALIMASLVYYGLVRKL